MENKKFGIFFSTQQECFDYYRGTNGSTDYIDECLQSIVYGGSDTGHESYKKYIAFQNLNEYFKWTKKQKNKNFYEQIREEFSHCEYYDIDAKSFHNIFKKGATYILDLFFTLYQKWLNTTEYPHKDIFDKNKHAYILQSEKPEIKLSFHIILRHGFLFQHMDHTKIYMKRFLEFLKQENQSEFLEAFDDGVYTKNRLFRAIHQCKIDEQDRPLERSNYNLLSLTCDEKLFFVTNIYPEMINLDTGLSLENEVSYRHHVEGLNYIDTIIHAFSDNTCSPDEEEEMIFSNDESIILFKNLNIKRWDSYVECPKLIWLAKNMNLSDNDIHLFCKTSEKYSYQWVQDIIEKRNPLSMLRYKSLLYFLRQDVDRNTYNNIVPKSLKYDEIMKKDKKDWTKEEQNFIIKINEKIAQNNLNILTKTTLINPIIRTDDFVVSDIYHGSGKKINIIKAGLGRGKSQSVNEFIKKNHTNGSIIVLTPRRSYARSAKERLIRETGIPFICYSDQKKSLIEVNHVVIQAESLYRLDLTTQNNILLIIDEVEAFLYQLTSTITHKENHIKNVETFIELVKQSQKCIALDAFISDRTLQTFKTLSGTGHIDFFEYTKQIKQRKAIEIDDIEFFINSIILDLEKGKKIFLFSSSNTKLLTTKIKHYKADKDGNTRDDKIIRALIPAIREKLPNKNILEFHSKFMSVQLTNVNTDWSKADLVCCTSTITVGCNFDIPDIFHKVYLYANASSRNLVRDMFQASWRVRHLIDNEMIYCLDENHYGMNLTCNMKEIRHDVDTKNELVIQLSYMNNIYFKKETPEIIKNLFCFNKFEANMSIMSLRSVFDTYLELCNYKKEILNEDDILEVEFKQFVSEDNIQYNDIPEITPSKAKQFITKKINTPLLELESLQLEKFYFQCQLLNKSSDIEEGLWKLYKNFGKGKFRNISIEKGFLEGTCTIQDIIEKESYSHLNSGTSLRVKIIQEIIHWIGAKHTYDYGFVLTKDKLNTIIKNFEENRQTIHVAFDMRDRTKDKLDAKSTLGLINKVFERWNYSKVSREKQKRKMVKGTREDNSEYILVGYNNDNLDIANNIKPYKKNTKDVEKRHPLLLCKDDAKIITNDELENIRLNR